jgi:hypothetical protein
VYAQAYSLGCHKFMSDLTEHIIKKFLNTKNCIAIMVFAERFKN